MTRVSLHSTRPALSAEAPLRILMICHHARDWDAGAASVPLNIGAQLQRRGHTVEHRFIEDVPGVRAIRDFRFQQLLLPEAVAASLLRSSRPFDVVDATSASGWILFPLLRSSPGRRPTTIMRSVGLEHLAYRELCVDVGLGHERMSRRYRVFHESLRLREVSRAIRSSDAMICMDTGDRDFVVQSGWKSDARTFVIAGGVDEEFFTIERRPPRSSDGLEVLWWGSWTSRKGIRYLGPAVSRALEAGVALRLTIGGTQLEPAEVLSSFPDSVRPVITVLPFVSRREQRDIFAAHDCLLFPSLYEGFGLAALEAMAAGLPVITTPTGIGRDIIRHGHSGIVVPPRDGKAMADALIHLASNREALDRLSRAAREVARSYTWMRAAELTEEAYLQAHAMKLAGKPDGSTLNEPRSAGNASSTDRPSTADALHSGRQPSPTRARTVR